MRYRTFGRTGWQVSEIGYGMWGMGGWTARTTTSRWRRSHRAVDLGCNFFDTAWAYGEGTASGCSASWCAPTRRPSDRRHQDPAEEPEVAGQAEYAPGRHVFPPDHIREFTEKSLENLGLERLDLMQFHVWDDAWADDDGWQRAIDDLKSEGMVRALGISVNRWEPENVLARHRHRPHRRRAGRLQHLRPGAGRRAVPRVPRARRGGDRARAVRRGHA